MRPRLYTPFQLKMHASKRERERYKVLRDAGLCIGCKAESPDKARCESCSAKQIKKKRGERFMGPYFIPCVIAMSSGFNNFEWVYRDPYERGYNLERFRFDRELGLAPRTVRDIERLRFDSRIEFRIGDRIAFAAIPLISLCSRWPTALVVPSGAELRLHVQRIGHPVDGLPAVAASFTFAGVLHRAKW